MQTTDFLGRELGSRLKESNGGSNAESARSSTAERERGDEDGGEELLGRERRKGGADPLDLEVIDDRDLYQHLLKVQHMLKSFGVWEIVPRVVVVVPIESGIFRAPCFVYVVCVLFDKRL